MIDRRKSSILSNESSFSFAKLKSKKESQRNTVISSLNTSIAEEN